MNTKIGFKLSAIIVALGIVAGCASLSGMPSGESQDSLVTRARTMWDAKISMDWGKVYDILAESKRKAVSREKYGKEGATAVKKYNILRAAIEEPGKRGRVIVEFIINSGGYNFTFMANEEWIWENNNWFMNLSKPSTRQELKKLGVDSK
ncbi:MAG: hypothetical protein JW884_14710 [Deltaproteobacteria bacterium]|nr:hypothetical protein [Deltaproteobacteria bacterium]